MSTTGQDDTGTGDIDVAQALAQIVKGQQMAGHFPDSDAMEAARQILAGQTDEDESVAAFLAKYGNT